MFMLCARAQAIEDPMNTKVVAINNIFLPNMSLNLVQTTRNAGELLEI